MTVLAQVIGLTSAGLFTGYTLGLSLTAVPAVLHAIPVEQRQHPGREQDAHAAANQKARDSLILHQWRQIYISGGRASIPFTIANILSFGFLAHRAPAGSLRRRLLLAAAALTGSGIIYAWTFLRRTNGALAIRARKMVGPLGGSADAEPVFLTYAVGERRSVEREGRRAWSTEALVRRWAGHNWARAGVMAVGVLVGGIAVALE